MFELLIGRIKDISVSVSFLLKSNSIFLIWASILKNSCVRSWPSSTPFVLVIPVILKEKLINLKRNNVNFIAFLKKTVDMLFVLILPPNIGHQNSCYNILAVKLCS